jgi:lysophospholipase L1-like esterase
MPGTLLRRMRLLALRWRSVLATTGIVLLSVIAALALFELVVDQRLKIRSGGSTEAVAVERPDAPPPTFFAQSFEREFSLMDPATGRILPGGRVTETFDQFGMRALSTRSSFPDATTVALVGDSYTAGAEVPFEDTLQARIAARLTGVNVMNFGVSGSNSRFFAAQARGFIERTGKRPDIYVVGLYKDMQVGDIPRREAVERSGGRVMYRGVQISRTEYERLEGSWIRRAAFEAGIFLREHSSSFNVLFPPRPSHGFAIPQLGDLTPERFAKWRADVLASLRELGTTSPGARMIVWLVPSNHDLLHKMVARRKRKPRPVPEWVGRSDEFWAGLSRELRAAGADVIDPTETIEGLLTGPGGEYPFTASGHFRPSAYAAVAERIVPCLASRLDARTAGTHPDPSACL